MKPKGTKDKKHLYTGLSRTRFYNIYKGMWQRCNDKNFEAYKKYGARGIECKWMIFIDFKRDMYVSYLQHCVDYGEKQTSIDRINNDKGYYKSNCRWATQKEQANNRRYKGRKRKKIIRANISNIIIPQGLSRLQMIALFRKNKCTYKKIGEYFGITRQATQLYFNRKRKNKERACLLTFG